MMCASSTKAPPPHSQLLLSGYTYQPEIGPCWQVDDLTTNPTSRYVFPVCNQTLSLQLLSTRHCIGTYDAATRQYIPCPHKRQVKPPYQNCYPCFEAIGFNPAFYNVPPSQLSSRQQAYNRQPHFTYLAYFGPNTIKVGIAHQQRRLKRWLEQGARAAVVLQDAQDAYAARALEAKVSKTMQIAERVTVAKKKQLLNIPYSFEEAKQLLIQHREAIGEALSPLPIVDLQPHYFPQAQPSKILDADRQKQLMAGRVVSMVGELVVYEVAGYFWMSSIKKYLGVACVQL